MASSSFIVGMGEALTKPRLVRTCQQGRSLRGKARLPYRLGSDLGGVDTLIWFARRRRQPNSCGGDMKPLVVTGRHFWSAIWGQVIRRSEL